MRVYKEDTNLDSGILFFIFLFSLFVMVSSGNYGNHTSSASQYLYQTELVFGSNSCQHHAVLYDAFSLPDIQKYSECVLHNSDLIPFSIQNKVSDYNRRICQNFIRIQEIRLSIEPVLPWSLYYHVPLSGDDYPPVLS